MDLYSLLGLAPGASPADIKRAYRRLARRYHPGINPGDRAAESLYGQIAEAYETLVDPDRRRAYDSAGTAVAEGSVATFEFSGFDFSAGGHGPPAAPFPPPFAQAPPPPGPAGARGPGPGAGNPRAGAGSVQGTMRR